MDISREDVLRIARLARLRVGEEEAARFTRDLNHILAHALELMELTGEEPAPSSRPDEATAADAYAAGAAPQGEAPPPDPLLLPPDGFAPAFEDGLFTLPRLEALDDERSPEAG